MANGGKTFVRITNQHIYDKLELIEKKVDYTNGKVRMHEKILWALGTMAVGGFLFIIGKMI